MQFEGECVSMLIGRVIVVYACMQKLYNGVAVAADFVVDVCGIWERQVE